ncbi:hypothetical protein Dimus_033853 [Dionaea muscipula]
MLGLEMRRLVLKKFPATRFGVAVRSMNMPGVTKMPEVRTPEPHKRISTSVHLIETFEKTTLSGKPFLRYYTLPHLSKRKQSVTVFSLLQENSNKQQHKQEEQAVDLGVVVVKRAIMKKGAQVAKIPNPRAAAAADTSRKGSCSESSERRRT